MALVPRPEILRLHAAAVACGHASRRTALLGGIDLRVVAGLPNGPDTLALLLSDLSALNDIGRLPDGSTPLLMWAANARILAGPRVEAEVFRALLEHHGAGDAAPEPAPPVPGSMASPGNAHHSTVISYGAADEPFARRLRDALRAQGVATFLFVDDAVPGMALHRVARRTINEHDRVILICSRASLGRRRVLNDIEEVLRRETRDGGASYFIPVRLDGYVIEEWAPTDPWVGEAVRDRFVADFEGADVDDGKFDAALLKLVAALKK